MGQAFTPGLQLLTSARVRRLRELPLPGKVEVSLGQQVTGDQVVLRSELPGELVIVRTSEELGIEPEELQETLRVKEGETLVAGDLLAEYRGFFGLIRSHVNSPVSGTVEFITLTTGHIGIRLQSEPIEVKAYISGTVEEVIEKSAVVIGTDAALVQGIFGVGGERLGRLHLLQIDSSSVLDEAGVPENIEGAILVGGASPTIAALQLAAKRGASGLVIGSIDDRCLAEYLGYDLGIALTGDEQVPMTVVVTEGFGSLPISERVLEILKPLDGRQCSLSGATQVRAGAIRPELLVPRSADELPGARSDQSPLELNIGASIRVIRYPLFGSFGTVVELPVAPERIQTGAFTRVLRAQLENGEVVTLPRANVELVVAK